MIRRMALAITVLIILGGLAGVVSATPPNATFVQNATTNKSLPQNLLTSWDLFEDFEDDTQWTNGTGQKSQETLFYKTGVASLNITSTPIGTAGYQDKFIGSVIPGGSTNTRIFVNWDTRNWNVTSNGGTLYFTSDPSEGLSTFFSGTLSSNQNEGWNTYNIVPSDWGNTGGESWSNIMQRERVRVASATTTCVTYDFDTVYTNITAVPAVVLTFDDEYIGIYNYIYPYAKARGIVGTQYVIRDNVGIDAAHMNKSQLLEIQNDGWEIASHASTNHTHLNLLSYEEQLAQIVANKEYVALNYSVDSSNDGAYPYGDYNNNTIYAMKAAGMRTGRTTNNWRHPVLPYGDLYQIQTKGMLGNLSSDIETFTGHIDSAISRGEVAWIYAHNVSQEVIYDGVTIQASNYTALLDYIHQRDIQVLTPAQFYALTTGPIIVKNPHESVGVNSTTVQFNDTSSNSPTSWNWSFGDGSYSVEQNPIHTFSSGNHSIILTATNADGVNISTFSSWVNVSTLLSSSFTPTGPLSVTYPNGVAFTDTSTGSPTNWNWSFGDGTFINGTQNVYHFWKYPGVYTITLNASTSTEYSTNSTVVNVVRFWKV